VSLAHLDTAHAVAELILDNPPLNLVDLDVVRGIEEALGEVARWAADGSCRALILRAEGRIFCAGVDVHHFLGHDPESGRAHIARHLSLTRRIEALPIPTLAVVQGLCLTIGFEIALGCDMLWAAESVQFGLVEANVGLTPGAGGTQRLVSRAGISRAAELVYTGDRFSAEQLMEWGVLNRVLGAGDLLPEARTFARRLAQGPTRAHAVARTIMLAAQTEGVAAADAITPASVGELLTTDDLVNGVRSLLDDGPGKATFAGR
jgi:enoyl-CoA hydratase/carnithine racemase